MDDINRSAIKIARDKGQGAPVSSLNDGWSRPGELAHNIATDMVCSPDDVLHERVELEGTYQQLFGRGGQAQDRMPQRLLAEIGKMLDDRFQKQSAHLENLLLEFKGIDKVEGEQKHFDREETGDAFDPGQADAEEIGDALDVGQADAESAENGDISSAVKRLSVEGWVGLEEDAMEEQVDDDNDEMYAQFFSKGANPETFDVLPCNILRWLGYGQLLPKRMPNTCLARATDTRWYHVLEACLIVGGTIAMALEADESIKAALSVPQGEVSKSFFWINLFFNASYAVDLFFRIFALRVWFVVSPDWQWNLLDTFVVSASFFSMMVRGSRVGFLRSLRIIRAVRAFRIIRVLRFFRELQRIMTSIVACVGSLVWCFIFLTLVMFVFSLLIVQWLSDYFDDHDPTSPEYEREVDLAREWYGSLGQAMWSLLVSTTGGTDWLDVMLALQPAGRLAEVMFVLYVVFVTIAVMNVLTGVFLACANEIADREFRIQGKQIQTEKMVLDLCSLFQEVDVDMTGSISWQEFKKTVSQVGIQNYLASHDLDCTHAHLLFDLLDDRRTGSLSMHDFVMGMVRLKGNSKAIDARAIQRECAMMPKILDIVLQHDAPPGDTKLGTSSIPDIGNTKSGKSSL